MQKNVEEYAGLLGRACPAAVYEYVDAEGDTKPDAVGKTLVINSQNCIHCKVSLPFFAEAGGPGAPFPPATFYLRRTDLPGCPSSSDLLYQGKP